MAEFRADLHIHTVLSPCGELEMSPSNIVRIAKEKGLDIIGITDHNSTRQAKMVRDLGREHGIYVLTGAEVTTAEEAHCLAFLPDDEKLDEFQAYLDAHLPFIRNNPEKFGYQVVVNVDEEIIYEEERLLIPAINQSIEEVEKKVHSLNGIFIPAHIDKKMYSVLSQLGFIPPTLRYDALELSRHTTVADFIAANPYLKNATFIQSSDAHFPDEIGSVFTIFDIPSISFENIQKKNTLI
ncbi:MAG: PHP domain-containing protein [Culturomica sp.]|jgi:PHP family Zn ribbon phosphoesterase|nr:PHP domain-containing protein [Culturomica sp.]